MEFLNLDNSYICQYINEEKVDWQKLKSVSLVDVVSGMPPENPTSVKLCWDTNNLYARFECYDDFQVATMKQRDDPLYNEDVIELFISESSSRCRYVEIEVSPNNVVFDAMIEIDENGKFTFDKSWDAIGLETSIEMECQNSYIYTIKIPFKNFDHIPIKNTEWFINLFRIDIDRNGNRSYQAWSPTGMINFHIPEMFGRLLFK